MIRLVALILAMFAAGQAAAHEVRPAYLELIEQRPSEWSIVWKQPVMGDRAVKLEPRLSNGWLAQKPSAEELTPSQYTRRWHIRAPAAELAGATVSIGGLERTITDVLVHARTADGKSFDKILHGDTPRAKLDFGGGEGVAVPAYLRLGVEHILAGADHLLFVLGLVLLTGLNWRLVWVVTSFTLGHSVTLAASTLGFVQAPVAVIEALVALSIVFVARELLRGDFYPPLLQGRGSGGGDYPLDATPRQNDSPHPNPSPEGVGLTRSKPWLIALLFGLLHGFAFAGALAETGLPPGDIPLALLLFNLGVEAGQLMFVGAVLAAMLVWRRFLSPSRLREGLGEGLLATPSITSPPPAPPASARGEICFTRRLVPYAMGCYAAFLFVERTAAAFA